MTIPPDIPGAYHELLLERASLMHEGSRLPDTSEGHREADGRAIADIRRVIEREEDKAMRGT